MLGVLKNCLVNCRRRIFYDPKSLFVFLSFQEVIRTRVMKLKMRRGEISFVIDCLSAGQQTM